jgi:hypothetical protein
MLATGPDALTRQAARRIGLPSTVGFGAYDLTNAAMDAQWADNIGLGRNDLRGYGSSVANLWNNPVDYAKNTLGGSGLSDLYTRMNVGFDVSDEDIARHRANKSIDYGGGLAGYKHQNINSTPMSDASDGYHIRSGKDFGSLATGDLPGGGIPSAISGIVYQQLMGLGDGTVGKNAWLQSVDNIAGLRESGKAPALDTLFNYGSNLASNWNDFNTNPVSKPVNRYGVKNTNVFNAGTIDATEQLAANRAAYAQRREQAAKNQAVQQSINPVANVPQAQYEASMDNTYKNVATGGGNTGYTGQGSQSRAGVNRRSAPAPRQAPVYHTIRNRGGR